MMPDYDQIATIYDSLTKLVFGNSLERAKKTDLDCLKAGDKVLIVGGGTGSVLEYIDQFGTKMEVDYIELSGKMLGQARKRKIKYLSINFFEKDVFSHYEQGYDAVITHFFLDQFDELQGEKLVMHMVSLLRPSGLLLNTDFVETSRLWDQWLLTLMYYFFRMTSRLGKVQLIDYKSIFLKNGLILLRSTRIRSNVVAEVFKRQ